MIALWQVKHGELMQYVETPLEPPSTRITLLSVLLTTQSNVNLVEGALEQIET